jgi:hypothetical protein
MSRNALILEKRISPAASPAPLQPVAGSGDFLELVRRFFRSHCALAVIGSGAGSRSAEACRGMAADLAACGRRVVIVQVDAALQAHTLPATHEYMPGKVANVWLWPVAAADPVEFFASPPAPSAESDWLASLRHDFDAVLLDCAGLHAARGAGEIAALADAAVLVAEAGQTTRQQIQRDQRNLELHGIKLAGCILMQRR